MPWIAYRYWCLKSRGSSHSHYDWWLPACQILSWFFDMCMGFHFLILLGAQTRNEHRQIQEEWFDYIRYHSAVFQWIKITVRFLEIISFCFNVSSGKCKFFYQFRTVSRIKSHTEGPLSFQTLFSVFEELHIFDIIASNFIYSFLVGFIRGVRSALWNSCKFRGLWCGWLNHWNICAIMYLFYESFVWSQHFSFQR